VQGDLAKAAASFDQAIALFERVDEPWSLAECQWCYGMALAQRRLREQALPLLRAALAYKRKIARPGGRARGVHSVPGGGRLARGAAAQPKRGEGRGAQDTVRTGSLYGQEEEFMIIAQISDPHINEESDQTAAQLQRAVAHLAGLPSRPDAVVITGDCTHNGRPAEYARLRELLRPLPMPVYVIPGNHDNREELLEAFGPQGSAPLADFVQYTADVGPLRLVALDTNVPGRGEGALCAARLAWLEERLAEAPDRPTLLLMHHPPFRTGLAVLDQIGLLEPEALGALIARHPQVERIAAGHVHMAMLRRFAGTLVVTCPATAHNLLPDLGQPERLVVQTEPPACLLHAWDERAGLFTYTSLIGEHGPTIELHDGTQWRS
jgi:Icc-related predicted phosphoesterase